MKTRNSLSTAVLFLILFSPISLSAPSYVERQDVYPSNLVCAIKDYIRINNENPKPFVWTNKVDAFLGKIAHCKAVTVTAQ